MTSTGGEAGKEEKLGASAYVLAGMSFIPLIGVVFGLIAIGRGIFTNRKGGKILALIGAGGIFFTVLLYGSLFYFGFVQRGGIYDELRTRLAQNNLNALVKVIEYYKLEHSEYPETLQVLQASLPKDSIEAVYIIDPRAMRGNRYFYYLRVGTDHYYLRGLAPDGKPFSPGALVPQVSASDTKIGLLIDPPADEPK